MLKPFSRKFFVVFLLFLSTCYNINAQDDSIQKMKVTLNGYLETYYLFDFGLPAAHQRPNFYVSHNRHNEFNLNMGMMRIAAEQQRLKAALGLMTGTYVNSNLAIEPGVLKNIYEANVAYKLSKNKNLWIQVGIFSSHIGFESAIGADCFTLTRSIAADNSPYYESGARLNFKSKNERWDFSFLVLNGWQRIQRLNNNNTPSFGTQVTFTNKTLVLNSSSYIGNEGTDAAPVWRYFHNFYAIKKLGSKSTIIVGLDAGLQHHDLKSSLFYWYSPQFVYKYNLLPKLDIAARVEHYYDPDAVIISSQKNSTFNMWGASFNFDFHLLNNVLFRMEFKQLNNEDPVFNEKAPLSRYNSSVAGAFTVKF